MIRFADTDLFRRIVDPEHGMVQYSVRLVKVSAACSAKVKVVLFSERYGYALNSASGTSHASE